MANSVTEYICDSARKAFASHGPGAAAGIVREMIAAKKFTPRQLNLKHLAVGCFGAGYESRLRRVAGKAEWVADATEASADLSAFRGVLNQTVATVEEDGTKEVRSIADQLVTIEPMDAGDPDSEVTTWRPAIGQDKPRDVLPGTPYPRTGFRGWYITKPKIDKFGLITYLTLEMIEANDVAGFLDAKAEVRRLVELEETNRKLRVVYGVTNNYSRNGTSYNTYLTSGDRVNKITDFDISDGPAELDRLDAAFRGMRHPITGKKLDRQPSVLVSAALTPFTLNATLGVTTIRTLEGSGSGQVESEAANPFQFTGPVLNDPLAEDILTASASHPTDPGLGLSTAVARTVLLYGNPRRAFRWRQKESLAQFEAGPDEEGWGPPMDQDVVYATKTRSRGAGYVYDPFEVVMAYNSAAS